MIAALLGARRAAVGPAGRGLASPPLAVTGRRGLKDEPEIKAALRRLYKKIHPDLFQGQMGRREVNERSFQLLQAFLAAAAPDAAWRGAAEARYKFEFFVAEGDDDGAAGGRAGGDRAEGDEGNAVARSTAPDVSLVVDAPRGGGDEVAADGLRRILLACGVDPPESLRTRQAWGAGVPGGGWGGDGAEPGGGWGPGGLAGSPLYGQAETGWYRAPESDRKMWERRAKAYPGRYPGWSTAGGGSGVRGGEGGGAGPSGGSGPSLRRLAPAAAEAILRRGARGTPHDPLAARRTAIRMAFGAKVSLGEGVSRDAGAQGARRLAQLLEDLDSLRTGGGASDVETGEVQTDERPGSQRPDGRGPAYEGRASMAGPLEDWPAPGFTSGSAPAEDVSGGFAARLGAAAAALGLRDGADPRVGPGRRSLPSWLEGSADTTESTVAGGKSGPRGGDGSEGARSDEDASDSEASPSPRLLLDADSEVLLTKSETGVDSSGTFRLGLDADRSAWADLLTSAAAAAVARGARARATEAAGAQREAASALGVTALRASGRRVMTDPRYLALLRALTRRGGNGGGHPGTSEHAEVMLAEGEDGPGEGRRGDTDPGEAGAATLLPDGRLRVAVTLASPPALAAAAVARAVEERGAEASRLRRLWLAEREELSTLRRLVERRLRLRRLTLDVESVGPEAARATMSRLLSEAVQLQPLLGGLPIALGRTTCISPDGSHLILAPDYRL